MLRWLLPVLIGAVVLLASSPVPAVADPVVVATVSGTILDADATRVLYRTADGQTLRLKDTGAATDLAIPLPPGSTLGANDDGRLIPDGALVSATKSGNSEPTLFEWHSGDMSPTELGIVNPPHTIHVAGNYAVWNNSSGLNFRNVALDSPVELVSNSAGDGSVAANGVVVFSRPTSGPDLYQADVYRWQSPGPATQLSTSGYGKRALSPLTDGTNTVWASGGGPPGAWATQVVANDGTPGNETTLDDSLDNPTYIADLIYRINAGWIAYPREAHTQVWTRSPAGTYSQVPTPTPPQTVYVRALNPNGQVVYERRNGDGTQLCDGTETLFVGTPGAADAFPVESKPFDSAQCHLGWSAFWSAADQHWYVVRPNALVRLDTDTAIVDGPPAATSDSVANFRFASTAASPEYTCTLDDAPVVCTNTYTTASLPDGAHTLTVKSKDLTTMEQDATVATRTWTIDHSAPDAFALTNPAEGAATKDSTPTFTWQAANDSDSGISGYDVFVDGHLAASPSTNSYTPGNGLADGQHTWHVVAKNGAGLTRDSGSATFSVDTATPPTARIEATPNPALEGESVQFSAAATTAGSAPIARYEWDLDGDGVYERDTGAEPAVTTTYGSPFDVTVGVRVTDSAGRAGTAQLAVAITPAPLPGVPGISINGGDRFTNNRHVTLTARWPKYATSMLIANDGGFDGAEPRALRAHPKWKLASSGKERLPTTVYVRFAGGLAGDATYQDDIVLDLTDPILASASAKRAGRGRFEIRLRARERISGVRSMQFARNKSHPGRRLRFSRKISLIAAKPPRFARVIDGAGNRSGWRRIARG